MRKWSTIIYSGSGWDLTVRELMFSIVIILVMLTGGFFISEKIASHNDEQNQEYYQAMQIDGNAELFRYGMRTDVGSWYSTYARICNRIYCPNHDDKRYLQAVFAQPFQ